MSCRAVSGYVGRKIAANGAALAGAAEAFERGLPGSGPRDRESRTAREPRRSRAPAHPQTSTVVSPNARPSKPPARITALWVPHLSRAERFTDVVAASTNKKELHYAYAGR